MSYHIKIEDKDVQEVYSDKLLQSIRIGVEGLYQKIEYTSTQLKELQEILSPKQTTYKRKKDYLEAKANQQVSFKFSKKN